MGPVSRCQASRAAEKLLAKDSLPMCFGAMMPMPVMRTSRSRDAADCGRLLGRDAGATLNPAFGAARMAAVLAPPKPRDVLSVARSFAGLAFSVARLRPSNSTSSGLELAQG